MNLLFLMDPLDKINCEKDTTFQLMVGAHNRGHRTFYLPKGGIVYQNGQFFFHVTQVIARVASRSFLIKEELILTEKDVHSIFIRTDPPFDNEYLTTTWLLDQLSPHIVVVNHPSGVRTANEKLWSLQFKDLIPPTMISRHRTDFKRFLSQQGSIIAKPIDGYGGASIFKITEGDSNANVIFETLTNNGTQEAVFQRFIPEASKGDKRILLLNGNPLGAILRVHDNQDHRNNIFAGGSSQKASLTERDYHIAKTLKPHLLALGLFFVGIDVIGDYLIEVNVTSPTCLQEMNEHNQQNLDETILEKLENMIEARQRELQNPQLFSNKQ